MIGFSGFRAFCLGAVVITLAACGFSPMYGVNRDTSVGVQEFLALVAIENIPDREGQYLRNALIDRFYVTGRPADPQFTLKVRPIQENKVNLDITRSSDATRGQLRLTTTMELIDRQTDERLVRRTLTSIAGYNILSSEFSTRVAEQSARDNALDDLARQIELQIDLYFKRSM